jgi:hypothetical protein
VLRRRSRGGFYAGGVARVGAGDGLEDDQGVLDVAGHGAELVAPMMLPPVSLAMAKATQPAAVAAPGPALLPELPSSVSQGLFVWPPNQMSLRARSPRLSLALAR